MGYRSDVALVLCKEAVNKLTDKLSKLPNNENNDANEDIKYLFSHADEHRIDKNTGDELWYWEWIKWYPEYPSVDFVMSFINHLKNEDYLLIILGEEITDIEEEGEFYDNPFNVQLIRKIKI